ncbi:MAG: nickel pincer cofactor biosynthesis protein LarB [Candidatus Aminicenantes bacterium]|nr:nickel pincer cofactor biosynthesis protein LarB [Candidatus Aminicenantes bacterium]
MKKTIRHKIKALKEGRLSEADFLRWLENLPFSNDIHLKLDFHRKLRRGIPEVIFGQGKNEAQLRSIIAKFREMGENILITRIDGERYRKLRKKCPGLHYHAAARIVTFSAKPEIVNRGKILVLSAGASDEAVAEEAYVSSRFLGNGTDKEYDVGVACLPRVLQMREKFNDYAVIIVVAGMEGALPSVVAGLTSTPIIAVPTSVGYGSSFNGVAALLSMLNSCAGGIAVVNIDNGFGAAYQATLINQKIS